MQSKNPYWENYIIQAQYHLSVAAYTKVSTKWRDIKFTPNYNRFYLIKDGEGMLELAGKHYYPKRNQLLLLPGGIVQSYSSISDYTFEKYYCHFTAKTGGLNLFNLFNVPVFIDVQAHEMAELIQKFEVMIELYSKGGTYSTFKLQSILLDIIYYYMKRCNSEQVHLKVNSPIGKMDTLLAYIDDHISSSFTIGHLAELCHYHPKHLIRLFKQFTGCSPIQYINQRRIQMSKHLLISTNNSISEISYSIGLETRYFSKLFKESTGYSPSLYRRLMR
jgi:AraC-like DNA-binding protein